MARRVVVPEPEVAGGVPGVAAEASDPGDVVLVRPRRPGSGTAAGIPAARAIGAATVLLPDDVVQARWVAAVGGAWAGEDAEDLVRSLQALVSTLGCGGASVVRTASPDGAPSAALPLALLARLMRRAWRPCPHCRGGGGVASGPCGGCGMPITAAA
jgi:hypothetical protein